ncbi:MAG: hypothetical protein JNK04_06775 [Myxococcales bacterium]|nr:hypothetical protein [Myxococcales bacterium]
MDQPTLADVQEAYANDAVALARRSGVTLDFTEASLDAVDALLGALAGDDPQEPASDAAYDSAWLSAKIYGAYVGQVAIRVMGGAWEAEEIGSGIRPVLVVDGLRGDPQEKVMKRLTQDAYSGVGGYLRAIRAILARRTDRDS